MIKNSVWVLFFFILGQINFIYLALCSQSVLKIAGNILPGCHRWTCETLSFMDAKNHHYKSLSITAPASGLSLCPSESGVVLSLESFMESLNVSSAVVPAHPGHGVRAVQKGKEKHHHNFEKLLVFVQREGGIHIPNLWQLSALVINWSQIQSITAVCLPLVLLCKQFSQFFRLVVLVPHRHIQLLILHLWDGNYFLV